MITSGTLATERLIITGANGLIYEINAEAPGLSVQELSDQKYQEQINGTVISVVAYSAPAFSATDAFRCVAGGTASDTGTYISAKASGTYACWN